MASNLMGMASNLLAMASKLPLAMDSTRKKERRLQVDGIKISSRWHQVQEVGGRVATRVLSTLVISEKRHVRRTK